MNFVVLPNFFTFVIYCRFSSKRNSAFYRIGKFRDFRETCTLLLLLYVSWDEEDSLFFLFLPLRSNCKYEAIAICCVPDAIVAVKKPNLRCKIRAYLYSCLYVCECVKCVRRQRFWGQDLFLKSSDSYLIPLYHRCIWTCSLITQTLINFILKTILNYIYIKDYIV